MKLKRLPELLSFFSTYLSDSDSEGDALTTESFAKAVSIETRTQVISQIKELVASAEIPLEEIGTEANRWFGDAEEAKNWLERILVVLQEVGGDSGGEVEAKDSNGAVLLEGDSVQVIKDLKVKGGSSDLKRGTLIRKIHLIGDSENVECRVDGSTLVLKTIFLKKV